MSVALLLPQATPPPHVGDTRHRTGCQHCEDQDPDDQTVFEHVAEARFITTFDTEVDDHVDSDDASDDETAQTTERTID
jgi:hypothetical protein